MASLGSIDVHMIKTEHGGISVKPDPDHGSASPDMRSEDDIYEDAGDLDFTVSAQDVNLTRIPQSLWKTWSQMENDEEVRVGTIRIEGDIQDPKRISLLLSSELAVNTKEPKEYNMQISNRNTVNTFVFTEKDLPGYKKAQNARQSQDGSSLSYPQVVPRTHFQDRGKQSPSKVEKNKKWQPWYKKAIPKKTAIAGQVRQEINCLPVENEEYRLLMAERMEVVEKAKKKMKLLPHSHTGNLLAPGTLGSSGNFDSFIRTSGSYRGKNSDQKAARIPQNELLDRIYDSFKKYTYWPLKSLKAELRQPEAYLKQTLELVAHLVRQGPHAMTWQLKPEAKLGAYADAQAYDDVRDKVAPDFDGGSDTGEGIGTDDEDESLKLEDVMPN